VFYLGCVRIQTLVETSVVALQTALITKVPSLILCAVAAAVALMPGLVFSQQSQTPAEEAR
jgi:hypothetical protein